MKFSFIFFSNYKIRDLPETAPNGIKFTREEINAILGDNAVKLLNLS